MTNIEIGQRIKLARERASLNKKELAHKIQVADSTIKRYEDGDIKKIKMPIIESIAGALHVNPMWIIGKEPNMELRSLNFPTTPDDCPFNSALAKMQKNDYNLSKEEQEAIEKELPIVMEKAAKTFNGIYQRISDLYEKERIRTLFESFNLLNETGQNKAIEQLSMLAKIPEYQNMNIKDISSATIIDFQPRRDNELFVIPYYRGGISAGTGIFILGNEAEDDIELPDIPEYHYADFALDVNGDSMEPTFNDGDIALVSQNMEMQTGDIGVFVINGNAFIKELGKNELISHNKEYPNITIHEEDNVVCMGKVIGKFDD